MLEPLLPERSARRIGRPRVEHRIAFTELTAIREGESRTLIVRGEAGIGKTALLEYMVEAA